MQQVEKLVDAGLVDVGNGVVAAQFDVWEGLERPGKAWKGLGSV